LQQSAFRRYAAIVLSPFSIENGISDICCFGGVMIDTV